MTRKQSVAALLMGFVLLVGAWSAYTQEAAAPAEGADAPQGGEVVAKTEEIGKKTTFWGLVKQGGWTMVPLGMISVAGIGLIIYGTITSQESKMLRPDLVPLLQDQLGSLNLQDAKSTCSGSPCLLTNTLNAGLERIGEDTVDVTSMEKAMEEASVHEVTAGLKPISYLSVIAQIAPMLGLLGTVSGMIKAFQKIGLGGMGKPELLAANIGEAMITTATGLIIGIPTMFFYFFLKGRYMSNVSQLNRILGNLCHHLVVACRDGGAVETTDY